MLNNDIVGLCAWLITVPLWQRYGLKGGVLKGELERAMKRGDLLLVAEVKRGEVPVGFAWCKPGAAFGRSGYLRMLGVQEGARGRGVGAALLGEVENFVGAMSNDLFLLVSDFNERAKRFYEQHGYAQVGALAAYILPDVTELIYRKQLDD